MRRPGTGGLASLLVGQYDGLAGSVQGHRPEEGWGFDRRTAAARFEPSCPRKHAAMSKHVNADIRTLEHIRASFSAHAASGNKSARMIVEAVTSLLEERVSKKGRK